jgi:RNA polymerase sigma factor (TIGR02999 family)
LAASLAMLFAAAERGDPAAVEGLFAALYAELHRLAARQLARSAPGAGLGTTSLLHEAYLDMSQREGTAFPDRARFFGYAARVMRGHVIDAVRRRQAEKRGGKYEITGLDGKEIAAPA